MSKIERVKLLLETGMKPSRIATACDVSTDFVFDVSHGVEGDYSFATERRAPMLQEEYDLRFTH